MIKLIQKEFDLLEQVANFVPTESKPYKVVSVNNGAVKALVEQGLVQTRQKEGNALMLEVVLSEVGLQVIKNEVEHEIVISHEEPTNEVKQMEEVQQTAEIGQVTDTVQQATGGFVIEDNVPLPELAVTRKPRGNTMPLDLMQVGQSFFVPFKEGEDVYKGRKRVSATVSQTKKRKLGEDTTAQFVTAIVENGYRVWRNA